jgi:hypothetical protein
VHFGEVCFGVTTSAMNFSAEEIDDELAAAVTW